MEVDKKTHEVTIATHLAQQAMATPLAAGASEEDSIAAGQAASVSLLGEDGLVAMHD
jgi:hypothetical protein